MSKYTEMESYFNVVNQMMGSKKTYEDLSISIDEVHHKFDSFKQTVNLLFAAPPPAPPKKEEAKPADSSSQ
jgi:hypothetical protein